MAAIYILSGYQNYFNRQIKEPKELVAAYPQNLVSYYDTGNVTQVINFNPADGVIAHHTVGRPENPYDGLGDYFLYTEDGFNVTSRWFIIESTRTRQGQYNVTLKRDVIADNYNKVLNADCFIQKATVNDESALIYNQEAITTNQIKKAEYSLKDESKMAWIVGFVNREAPAKTFAINSSVVEDYKMSDYRFKEYFSKDANSFTFIDGYVYVTNTQYSASPFASKFVLDEYANQTNLGNSTSKGDYKYTDQNGTLKSYIQSNGINLAYNIATKHSLYDGISSDSNYNSLLYEEGKIVKDGNDFYKIGIKTETHERTYRITEDKDGTYLLTYLTNFMKNFSGYKSGTPYFEIYIKYTSLRLTKTPIVEGEYTIDYPGKTYHLINKSAPFDVFCIPYADDMKIRVGKEEVQANKQFAMSIASELGRNLAGDCYDIQLLPFCPMTGYTVTDNIFDINSSDEKRRTAIKKGDTPVYWMFWSTSNSGTFNIHLPILAGNKKLANQCDMYRLVSPNYSGQFEFNLAKNGGYVEYFNVDYTYLPISSYIHVNPDFKGLYGSDFNDARGLICQGDFSIMYLSDPWKNYQ